jgi:endonuclease/exonuclease/phosphatase family metal-dependent hydrolase
MNRLISFRRLAPMACLLLLAVSCQEDIAVIPAPAPLPGGGGTPTPDAPIDPQYQPCLTPSDSLTLDVATWNLEFFPKNGTQTESAALDMLRNAQVDVVAVQEIDSWSRLESLAQKLGGWEVHIADVFGNQDLAFLYKPSEVEVLQAPFKIYPSENSAFPREPAVTRIRHRNGLEVVLVNIHLKCCGGGDNESRRREASRLLQEYMEATYPNDPAIVLGDWNDEIYEGGGRDVFDNFLQARSRYWFADEDVAKGSVSGWSYPSFPSHIDHLLITDELFDNFVECRTLRLNNCYSTYYRDLSDHRPVLLRLKKDE